MNTSTETTKNHNSSPQTNSLKTFQEMLPQYDLFELINDESGYMEIVGNCRYRLLENISNNRRLKFVAKLRATQESVVAVLSKPDEMLWNGEVELSEKLSMRDPSTYVVYHNLRSCSTDFVFVRHCFRYGTTDIFLDKSTEVEEHPNRGNIILRLVWVQSCETDAGACWVSTIAEIQYASCRSTNEEALLTKKYLLEMLDLDAYCRIKRPTVQMGSPEVRNIALFENA